MMSRTGDPREELLQLPQRHALRRLEGACEKRFFVNRAGR
jgi:hypothetical protein